MALITDIHCKECGKTKYEVTHHDSLCSDCRSDIIDKKRQEYLSGLKRLSIEDRISKIEADLYNRCVSNSLYRKY